MPVGWHKSGKLSAATGVMMKGRTLWNLAEMTPLPGTSFVALSKLISQVVFGCRGQKPNSNGLTLSYLSTETRKLREGWRQAWLDAGVQGACWSLPVGQVLSG